jgi:hypothetical protein
MTMGDSKARWWFGLTAAAVAFGIVVNVVLAATSTDGFFTSAAGRVFNVFCFFTIQSNLIVGITSLMLAIDPRRTSTSFDTFRLIGIVAIIITGLVYHSVLRGLFDLESWALVGDLFVHTVVPILAVVGWLIYGPRGRVSRRIMWLSLLFPLWWFAFALIRGPIADYYPYPFVDVIRLGYPKVLINAVWLGVLYLAVAAGLVALDRWLAKIQSLTAAAGTDALP